MPDPAPRSFDSRPATFRPAWWLPGAHAQTVWGALARRLPRTPTRRERFALPDGVRITLHHVDAPGNSPRVLLMHGLEGSQRSHYITGMLAECARRGWAATVLVARSCDGRMPRGRLLYHSGATGDLDSVARELHRREPGRPLHAVGYSMGANILGKWLGEAGDSAPVARAALVCTPFVLRIAGPALDRTAGGLYSRRFLETLIPKGLAKAREFPELLDAGRIRAIRTILDYDNEVTAPLHGFEDAWDYYDCSSSGPFLPKVRVRTLLLSAADDPLVPASTFPRNAARGSRWLVPALTRHGGHIGFVGGPLPWRARYWAEREVADFLAGAAG